MSVSKAEKSRFWIAFFLDEMPVGAEFTPGELHITLIPWFVTDASDDEVIDSFSKYFSRFKAFTAHLGEKAKFGPKKDAPITLIKQPYELDSLHSASLHWFEQIGGRWAVKNPYVGSEYKPHIRRRRGTRLSQNSMLVDSLTLVSAARKEDHLRRVVAKAVLK